MGVAFIAKCYNGHKTLIDDELDGETIICPICEEEFIASQNYEELGIVDDEAVPVHNKAYIHIGIGFFIFIIIFPLIEFFEDIIRIRVWGIFQFLSITLAILYVFRGIYELIHNRDPFKKILSLLYTQYFILLKKLKFLRK